MNTPPVATANGPVLVRHEGEVPRERSACGWRDRLISHEDAPLLPAAWAHAVDIEDAKPHYHRRSTELYYVLEGSGSVVLDGVGQEVRRGSIVHIPPGVVHSAQGRMRVLVVGIPRHCGGRLLCGGRSSAAGPSRAGEARCEPGIMKRRVPRAV